MDEQNTLVQGKRSPSRAPFFTLSGFFLAICRNCNVQPLVLEVLGSTRMKWEGHTVQGILGVISVCVLQRKSEPALSREFEPPRYVKRGHPGLGSPSSLSPMPSHFIVLLALTVYNYKTATPVTCGRGNYFYAKTAFYSLTPQHHRRNTLTALAAYKHFFAAKLCQTHR